MFCAAFSAFIRVNPRPAFIGVELGLRHRACGYPRPMSTSASAIAAGKRPFNIDAVVRRVRRAVEEFAPAAMFELRDDGYGSLFEQLVACILSIRTRDEVSLPTAKHLFARARTPEAMVALGPAGIDALIRTSTFHESKAYQIHAIAERVVREFGGEMPCDEAALLSFRGVGPKCANLALGIACGATKVSVDVHVHRVTNRWGYIRTRVPEESIRALEAKLPKRFWVEINRLLVPFGKHICTGKLPKCSTCPVLVYCRQVGVRAHR